MVNSKQSHNYHNMILRFITQLAQYLEELSRRDDSNSNISNCLRLWINSSLADKLYSPLITISYNPFNTLIVVIIMYIIFLIIYLPLYFLSFVVTAYGSYLLLYLLLNSIGVKIARTIAFPGSNPSVGKQIASDYIKRILISIDNIADIISDFSATLLLGTTGELPWLQLLSLDKRLHEIILTKNSISKLLSCMKESINYLTTKNRYGVTNASKEEITLVQGLYKTLEQQVDIINNLIPLATEYIDSGNKKYNSSRSMKGISSPTLIHRGSDMLIKTTSHCLKATELIKNKVIESRLSMNTNGNNTENGGNDNEGNFSNKMKSITSFNKGPEGIEKLSFPYMRAVLKQRFNAQQFTLKGMFGNIIDGAIIPYYGINFQQQDNNNNNDSPSRKGIVLYCSPNAGYYELFANVDINSSWLGFYMKMGYDICVYNYRGYGLSDGSPTPRGVKKDAEIVYRHIQVTRSPSQIIIHGESIGGMVACHLARKFPLDLLVCDRTFTSLESTAVRLLGSWAGLGLQYFALWSTDTATDYLACNCPKILLQDPADEIINHIASLKVGVALRVVLGDTDWKNSPEPRDYAYASYINAAEFPNKSKEPVMLAAVDNISQKIPEEFITHFYACIMDISKRAKNACLRQTRRKQQNDASANRSQHSGSQDSDTLIEERSGRDVHRRGSFPHHNHKQQLSNEAAIGTTRMDSLSLSKSNASSGNDLRGITDLPDSSPLKHHTIDSNQSQQHTMGPLEDCLSPPRNGTTVTSGSGRDYISDTDESIADDSDCSPVINDGNEGNTRSNYVANNRFSSKREWLDKFCNLSIRDSSSAEPRMPCNPQFKVWAVVARIDGGSGQLLGQALNCGVDGVRAWICSLLVWAPYSAVDASLPQGCTDIDTAVAELSELISSIHPAELENISSIKFVRSALGALSRRMRDQKVRPPQSSSLLHGAASFHSNNRLLSHSYSYHGNALEEKEIEITAMEGGHSNSSNSLTNRHSSGGSNRQSLSDRDIRDGAVACVGGEAGYIMQAIRSNEYLNTTVECLDHVKPIARIQLLVNYSRYMFALFKSRITGGPEPIAGRDGILQTVNPSTSMPYVGRIVALHCGHNGWPSVLELEAFKESISQLGIQ